MNRFRKIVAVNPIMLSAEWEKRLADHADNVELYPDLPRDDAEIVRRIGDADCVLVNNTIHIGRAVIEACPSVRYIGMCCSLYTPESACVDIPAAEERGIPVLGVRDYGDEGVAEYVVSELVRLLHGFGEAMWRDYAVEITGIPVGIIGMGTTGKIIARALKFFGAEVFYYSRTRRPELEREENYAYLPLDELLSRVDIACTCLHKNVILLGDAELKRFGDGKIVVNTSIGPSYPIPAMEKWLERPGNYLLCDTADGADPTGRLLALPNVLVVNKSAGRTTLAKERLGRKVMENIETFWARQR